MKNTANHGFTLIELMIVVAIIGILASIAYPSYRDSVLKGRRAEARTAIAELMQQQERYMTQNNTYYAFTNTSGVPDPADAPFKTFSGQSSSNPAYLLSAEKCPKPPPEEGEYELTECIMVVATPVQEDPAAGALTMTSTGEKSCDVKVDGHPSPVCWK